jgi:hypothetical protein
VADSAALAAGACGADCGQPAIRLGRWRLKRSMMMVDRDHL